MVAGHACVEGQHDVSVNISSAVRGSFICRTLAVVVERSKHQARSGCQEYETYPDEGNGSALVSAAVHGPSHRRGRHDVMKISHKTPYRGGPEPQFSANREASAQVRDMCAI
ncbi:hypothetical protein GCM10017559_82560 [Streptosporangium longisporum]|uniref:Uncharacterized protein n=1 Tax=Streptosporangium longisporum TaxID=46187 RepID=A0ABP6LJJ0_9ACTN